MQKSGRGIPQNLSFAVLLNAVYIWAGSTAPKGGSRTNMNLIVFLGRPSVPDSMLLRVWLMNGYFFSRCTLWRTSVHTRTFANLRLCPWVIPTCSYMSATTYAYKPPTVDGSLLWSLALSGPAILCSAFLAVSLYPTSKIYYDATNRGYRSHRTYWIFYPRGSITDKPVRARLLFPISTKL
jgi:hypothetical protein